MANLDRRVVTPRIARMLRELEGSPSGEANDESAVVAPCHGINAQRVTRHRKGHSLAAALAVVAAVLIVVMSALQSRAPDGKVDRVLAAGSRTVAHIFTDAGRALPPEGDTQAQRKP